MVLLRRTLNGEHDWPAHLALRRQHSGYFADFFSCVCAGCWGACVGGERVTTPA